jgi:hypothetical protein
MGTPTVLGKITTVVAIIFTLTSFSLALLGGDRSGSSVVREGAAPPAPPAATAPAPAPAAPAAPSK